MQAGSIISTGFSALAFKALNSSDALNSLVNFMTRGSVNRDTLAQKVLKDGLQMGLEITLSHKGLGDRSATLAPLASKIIFDNTSDEMYTSIKSFASELVFPDTNFGPGIGGALKSLGASGARLGAAGLAEVVGQTFTETQFTEKLLATMLHEHSDQPLKTYMENALSALPLGKKFVTSLVADVLQRAIVDKKELNQSDRPVFRLLAAEANQFITGEKNYKKPLAEYFTQAADTALPDAIEATAQGVVHTVAGAVHTIVDSAIVLAEGLSKAKESFAQGEYVAAGIQTTVAAMNTTVMAAVGTAIHVAPAVLGTAATLTGITTRAAVGAVIYATPTIVEGTKSLCQGAVCGADQLYHATVGAPTAKNASDAYDKDLQNASQSSDAPPAPALPALDARTRDSQWADALVKQQTTAQFVQPDLSLATDERCAPLVQAEQKGLIDSARKEALTDLTDKLSLDQLSPFGMFGTSLKVAHYVSGNLAQVDSESRTQAPIASATRQTMVDVIEAAPLKEGNKGGYKVADNYAAHVGKLALDFPADSYSTAEATLDAGKASLNYTAGSWGYADVNASDWAELRKLYNTCGGNEQQTLKVSSYLDPAMASQALAAPVLSQLDAANTGRLEMDSGMQLQLADSTPQYQYQLRRNGEEVKLTITASWDIAQYGMDAQQMRAPQGTQASQLTSSITITVPSNGPATHSAPTLECAIRNQFKFDTFGALEKPAQPG